MEIIWGNKLKAGDYKYVDRFPHYVADGGDDKIGQWLREEVDLQDSLSSHLAGWGSRPSY